MKRGKENRRTLRQNHKHQEKHTHLLGQTHTQKLNLSQKKKKEKGRSDPDLPPTAEKTSQERLDLPIFKGGKQKKKQWCGIDQKKKKLLEAPTKNEKASKKRDREKRTRVDRRITGNQNKNPRGGCGGEFILRTTCKQKRTAPSTSP